MSKVSVITGGAGGMGVATAKVVGRDHAVVLCDVRQDRLDVAAAALKDLDVTVINGDVTDPDAVARLFDTAAAVGPIASVIHAAGVSPSMGEADYVMRTNAIGTLNINEAFYGVAPEGAAIVNVASMAAHLLPEELIPVGKFPAALREADSFLADMAAVCEPILSGGALGYRICREQGVRALVQQCAGGTVQRPRTTHRLRLAGFDRHRDGPVGGTGLRGCAGRRRRGPALGQARRDGGTAGVLRQRPGGLPHRHRYPQRRWSGRLGARARAYSRRKRLI